MSELRPAQPIVNPGEQTVAAPVISPDQIGLNPAEAGERMSTAQVVGELGSFYSVGGEIPRDSTDISELKAAAARIRTEQKDAHSYAHYFDTETGEELSPTTAERVTELANTDWSLSAKDKKALEKTVPEQKVSTIDDEDIAKEMKNHIQSRVRDDASELLNRTNREKIARDKAVAVLRAKQAEDRARNDEERARARANIDARVLLSDKLAQEAHTQQRAEAAVTEGALDRAGQAAYDKTYAAHKAATEARAAVTQAAGGSQADRLKAHYEQQDAAAAAERQAREAASQAMREAREAHTAQVAREAEAAAQQAKMDELRARDPAAAAKLEFLQRLHGTPDGKPAGSAAPERVSEITERPATINPAAWLKMNLIERKKAVAFADKVAEALASARPMPDFRPTTAPEATAPAPEAGAAAEAEPATRRTDEHPATPEEPAPSRRTDPNIDPDTGERWPWLEPEPAPASPDAADTAPLPRVFSAQEIENWQERIGENAKAASAALDRQAAAYARLVAEQRAGSRMTGGRFGNMVARIRGRVPQGIDVRVENAYHQYTMALQRHVHEQDVLVRELNNPAAGGSGAGRTELLPYERVELRTASLGRVEEWIAQARQEYADRDLTPRERMTGFVAGVANRRRIFDPEAASVDLARAKGRVTQFEGQAQDNLNAAILRDREYRAENPGKDKRRETEEQKFFAELDNDQMSQVINESSAEIVNNSRRRSVGRTGVAGAIARRLPRRTS